MSNTPPPALPANIHPAPEPWTAPRIADFIARTFIHPDQITELRALNVGRPNRTVSGWFDGRHLLDLARSALAITRQASGVYFIPNPVNPELFQRCPNRTDEVMRSRWKVTADADILERRYLFVDLDPDRSDGNSKQPSTDAELAETIAAADPVASDFAYYDQWPEPLRMLSGNGVHLLFPIRTPIPARFSEYETDPLREYLEVCRDWHFHGCVRIDPNTYNAARLLKVPGTRVVKGTATPDRPYRIADVLRIPHDWPAPRKPPERTTTSDGNRPAISGSKSDVRQREEETPGVVPEARPSTGGAGGKSGKPSSGAPKPKQARRGTESVSLFEGDA